MSTTEAGSGHPTSCLSAVEITAALLFGGFFRARLDEPAYPHNDRLIFSKGHAAPLLYSLYAAAGKVSYQELLTLRKLGSPLEGHPALAFPYTEAPTGSLGQGLSIGLGMALNAQYLHRSSYRTFVLLGDSEMSEGSVWEALQVASYYRLGSLIGILDVNRLGQSRQTMLGHDVATYERRISAFGWNTHVIDGHSFEEIVAAYDVACASIDVPTMIIAKTFKGRGVSFLEDKEGWHGKVLSREECERACVELGDVDTKLRGNVSVPQATGEHVIDVPPVLLSSQALVYARGELVATRKAYGSALLRLCASDPRLVVLDAEVSNSTYAESVKKARPERFFEMFVAEQNMVGAALGLSRRGKKPCVSTFAAFLTRAADQIRMSQHADPDILFCGSHAGVSIGEDGPSQMALEDISLFRAVHGSVVLYPSDAVSTEKLVDAAIAHRGLIYLRTTRQATPVLYDQSDAFPIGGSKILRESANDVITLIAAGITLHEALKAADVLAVDGIAVRVIDLYSIKPIDHATLEKAARETRALLTIEDHYPQGGLGAAVLSALSGSRVPIRVLAVRTTPTSGKPEELLIQARISSEAIKEEVQKLLETS